MISLFTFLQSLFSEYRVLFGTALLDQRICGTSRGSELVDWNRSAKVTVTWKLTFSRNIDSSTSCPVSECKVPLVEMAGCMLLTQPPCLHFCKVYSMRTGCFWAQSCILTVALNLPTNHQDCFDVLMTTLPLARWSEQTNQFRCFRKTVL